MRRMTRIVAGVAVLALAVAGCSTATSGSDSATDSGAASSEVSGSDAGPSTGPLMVQFVPTRTEEDMQAQAKPLAELLSKQLNREVTVNIATDYATIVEAMASGKVDVGIMPPATYVLAHDRGAADAVLSALLPGTDPVTSLATDDKNPGFHGEIDVAADSGITSLADLKGKTIAVQNAASASGYIFPIVEMAEAGIDIHQDVKLLTVAGIDSAILAVINGDADAAFVFEGARRIMLKEFPDITDRISVAYLTKALIPNDAIAVNTKLSDADKAAVKAAFLAIAADPEGAEIISSLYSHLGYVEADQSAYDVVAEYIAKAADL